MKKKKNIETFFQEKFKNFEFSPPKNSWSKILRKLGKKNKNDSNESIERVFQEKFKDFEATPPKNSWNEIQRKLNKKNKSKNIERVFQEKFKDFEAKPPKNSWNKIQHKLKEKKSKKKVVIPIWFRYSGVAAILLVGFFVFKNDFKDSYNVHNFDIVDNVNIKNNDTISNTKTEINLQSKNLDNNTKTETITKGDLDNSVVDNSNLQSKNLDNNTKTETITKSYLDNSVVDNSNLQSKNSDINTKSDLDNSIVDNSKGKKQNEQISENENNFENQQSKIDSDKNNIVDNQRNDFIPTENVETNDKNSTKKDLFEEIKLAQEETEQDFLTTPKSLNKWRVTPTAGAVTMNSLSEGSPISDKLTENSKDYQTSMSYGLAVDYSLTKKLSIRTGINKLSTAYNTNDIVVYVSADRIEVLENSMNIETTTKDIVVTAKKPSSGGDSKTEGYINQKMGYIEVPIELSYKLLENKFGIEIIGGISTLFLQENEVSVLSNQMKTTLGKANNLSDTHFSTNIGVGFRYEISKSFDINLDPMFKYQLGTFEKNNGNFKPYLFGVYTVI